jgi:hypothetical protein
MEAKFFSLRCEKKFFFRLFRINAKRRNLKRNKNGTKRKQNEKEAKNCHHFHFEAKWSQTEAKNCHHFRFEAKWSETEAKNCHHFTSKAKWKQNFFALMRKNEMKQKQTEKEAKTSKRRIEWNSGTICKESKINIKAGLLLFHVYTYYCEKKQKTFISFHFEAKQSEKYVYFVSLWSETKRSEVKRKDWKRNEAKRKMFGSEIKQKYALLISLWSEVKNSKRNEAKRRGACETHAKRISFRFVSLWREKNFFCETGAP